MELLRSVLPPRIVERLSNGEHPIADRHERVAVLLGDLVGFTSIAARLPAAELVGRLGALFAEFDAAAERFGVDKIKTVGDAYLAAAGLPGTRSDHVVAAADLALAMRAAVRDAGDPWHVRIGLHRGPVVAGVIGSSKFVYDLWGDAVNVASRLETTAPTDQIQISETVAAELGNAYELQARGAIELKGKGSTETFLLVGRRRD